MEKRFFNMFRMQNAESIKNSSGATEDADSGMVARFTSFIMAWLLAIFFCLIFWYGVYLLLRPLLPKSSEGG